MMHYTYSIIIRFFGLVHYTFVMRIAPIVIEGEHTRLVGNRSTKNLSRIKSIEIKTVITIGLYSFPQFSSFSTAGVSAIKFYQIFINII